MIVWVVDANKTWERKKYTYKKICEDDQFYNLRQKISKLASEQLQNLTNKSATPPPSPTHAVKFKQNKCKTWTEGRGSIKPARPVQARALTTILLINGNKVSRIQALGTGVKKQLSTCWVHVLIIPSSGNNNNQGWSAWKYWNSPIRSNRGSCVQQLL